MQARIILWVLLIGGLTTWAARGGDETRVDGSWRDRHGGITQFDLRPGGAIRVMERESQAPMLIPVRAVRREGPAILAEIDMQGRRMEVRIERPLADTIKLANRPHGVAAWSAPEVLTRIDPPGADVGPAAGPAGLPTPETPPSAPREASSPSAGEVPGAIGIDPMLDPDAPGLAEPRAIEGERYGEDVRGLGRELEMIDHVMRGGKDPAPVAMPMPGDVPLPAEPAHEAAGSALASDPPSFDRAAPSTRKRPGGLKANRDDALEVAGYGAALKADDAALASDAPDLDRRSPPPSADERRLLEVPDLAAEMEDIFQDALVQAERALPPRAEPARDPTARAHAPQDAPADRFASAPAPDSHGKRVAGSAVGRDVERGAPIHEIPAPIAAAEPLPRPRSTPLADDPRAAYADATSLPMPAAAEASVSSDPAASLPRGPLDEQDRPDAAYAAAPPSPPVAMGPEVASDAIAVPPPADADPLAPSLADLDFSAPVPVEAAGMEAAESISSGAAAARGARSPAGGREATASAAGDDLPLDLRASQRLMSLRGVWRDRQGNRVFVRPWVGGGITLYPLRSPRPLRISIHRMYQAEAEIIAEGTMLEKPARMRFQPQTDDRILVSTWDGGLGRWRKAEMMTRVDGAPVEADVFSGGWVDADRALVLNLRLYPGGRISLARPEHPTEPLVLAVRRVRRVGDWIYVEGLREEHLTEMKFKREDEHTIVANGRHPETGLWDDPKTFKRVFADGRVAGDPVRPVRSASARRRGGPVLSAAALSGRYRDPVGMRVYMDLRPGGRINVFNKEAYTTVLMQVVAVRERPGELFAEIMHEGRRAMMRFRPLPGGGLEMVGQDHGAKGWSRPERWVRVGGLEDEAEPESTTAAAESRPVPAASPASKRSPKPAPAPNSASASALRESPSLSAASVDRGAMPERGAVAPVEAARAGPVAPVHDPLNDLDPEGPVFDAVEEPIIATAGVAATDHAEAVAEADAVGLAAPTLPSGTRLGSAPVTTEAVSLGTRAMTPPADVVDSAAPLPVATTTVPPFAGTWIDQNDGTELRFDLRPGGAIQVEPAGLDQTIVLLVQSLRRDGPWFEVELLMDGQPTRMRLQETAPNHGVAMRWEPGPGAWSSPTVLRRVD